MAEIEPDVSRPTMPEGYGIPATIAGALDWTDVEDELRAAVHYWLATVRPDGRPHAVPRWGVWVNGAFYYDGAPTTRHAVNAEANPNVSLHLESGTRVVIVEGVSTATRADADGLGRQLSAAFGKYHDRGYAPEPDAWSGEHGGGLRVVTAQRALAWFDFPNDCTRFVF